MRWPHVLASLPCIVLCLNSCSLLSEWEKAEITGENMPKELSPFVYQPVDDPEGFFDIDTNDVELSYEVAADSEVGFWVSVDDRITDEGWELVKEQRTYRRVHRYFPAYAVEEEVSVQLSASDGRITIMYDQLGKAEDGELRIKETSD